jgi:uncharacterized protein YdeI (YjbR/CyaY-like superfamily)
VEVAWGPVREFRSNNRLTGNNSEQYDGRFFHIEHIFHRLVIQRAPLNASARRSYPDAMQVPYAKKWQKETDQLRKIALDCDLREELKWGKPCFTFMKKNVAVVIPLKESCALSFFKGALLKDPKHILQKIGEHTQAGRWIKFTSLKEINALQATLTKYLYEAIKAEESGKKIKLKKPSEYAIPEELQTRLGADPKLRAAFEALTPGRRKSYIFHIANAKQSKTREVRAERCVPMILNGRGFNELRS